MKFGLAPTTDTIERIALRTKLDSGPYGVRS